jgi:hypothetical protein
MKKPVILEYIRMLIALLNVKSGKAGSIAKLATKDNDT